MPDSTKLDDARPVARHQPVRYADLADDLLWPSLLRTARLALRPGRLALGLLLVLLISAISDLGALWGEGGWIELAASAGAESLGTMVQGVSSLDGAMAAAGMAALIVGLPAALFEAYPVSTIVLPLPIAAAWVLFVGAICRMSVLEFGQGVFLSSFDALSFSRSRFVAMLGAALGTWVAAGLIVLALAMGGWLLFSWPLVNTVGSLVYPLFLLGALIAVLLLVVSIVGGPMFLAAVVCEGVDSLDAVQRVVSLIVAQPLRLMVYVVILGLLGTVAYFVVAMILEGSIALAAGAASAWSEGQGQAILHGRDPGVEGDSWVTSLFTSDPQAPRSIVVLWVGLLRAVGAGFLVSWYATASGVLFLVMRQATTGQERAEVWMPGLIEATMAEVLAGRAAAGPRHESRAAERLGAYERASRDDD